MITKRQTDIYVDEVNHSPGADLLENNKNFCVKLVARYLLRTLSIGWQINLRESGLVFCRVLLPLCPVF